MATGGPNALVRVDAVSVTPTSPATQPANASRDRGVTVASIQGLRAEVMRETARAAALHGATSLWTAETTGPEAFATLAALASEAPGLALGTGVLALHLRTPLLAAQGAATLQLFHPTSDVLLGVGISSPVVVGDWHGADYGSAPIAQTRQYLGLVRRYLDGETVNDPDSGLRKSRLAVRFGERRPKLVLGALNPAMLRLAGELADGVLLNYLPASAVAACVREVRAGETQAGRPEGSCRVYAYVHVGVCDTEAARPNARFDLYSYAVADAYQRAFTRAGFGEEMERLATCRTKGDRDGAVAAISDAMIDAIDICGTASTVTDAVAAYVTAGVDVPVVMPLPWGEDRLATILATLEAALA